MFRRTHGWFVGGGQLWVPQSTQNKTTIPKKKDSNSKNIRGLKATNRFLNSLPKTGHHVRPGFAAYRRGRLGSPLQLITTGYELRLIRDTRERYRSPTSLKNFSSWGATRHDRASSAAVEHPPRLFMT